MEKLRGEACEAKKGAIREMRSLTTARRRFARLLASDVIIRYDCGVVTVGPEAFPLSTRKGIDLLLKSFYS